MIRRAYPLNYSQELLLLLANIQPFLLFYIYVDGKLTHHLLDGCPMNPPSVPRFESEQSTLVTPAPNRATANLEISRDFLYR